MATPQSTSSQTINRSANHDTPKGGLMKNIKLFQNVKNASQYLMGRCILAGFVMMLASAQSIASIRTIYIRWKNVILNKNNT